MNHVVFVLMGLLLAWLQCRRDAQVRFLRQENQILRSRLDQQQLILAPEERIRLLAIGAELRHQVRDLISVVQFRTCQRWVATDRSYMRLAQALLSKCRLNSQLGFAAYYVEIKLN